MKCFKCRQALY